MLIYAGVVNAAARRPQRRTANPLYRTKPSAEPVEGSVAAENSAATGTDRLAAGQSAVSKQVRFSIPQAPLFGLAIQPEPQRPQGQGSSSDSSPSRGLAAASSTEQLRDSTGTASPDLMQVSRQASPLAEQQESVQHDAAVLCIQNRPDDSPQAGSADRASGSDASEDQRNSSDRLADELQRATAQPNQPSSNSASAAHDYVVSLVGDLQSLRQVKDPAQLHAAIQKLVDGCTTQCAKLHQAEKEKERIGNHLRSLLDSLVHNIRGLQTAADAAQSGLATSAAISE